MVDHLKDLCFQGLKQLQSLTSDPDNRTDFPRLDALARVIESTGWDKFDECSEILNQPGEKRAVYQRALGKDVLLFHKTERRDPDKRDKFLRRVRRAAKHLLDVYCKEHVGLDAESVSLSQHPSHGAKELANQIYTNLERHWRCNCPRGASRTTGLRAARLSLIRHRQLVTKKLAPACLEYSRSLAKFEVLLPVCKDTVEWKVTNIEVRNAM